MKLKILEKNAEKILISWGEETDELWEFIFLLSQKIKFESDLNEKTFEISINDIDEVIDILNGLEHNENEFVSQIKELHEDSESLIDRIEKIKNSTFDELLGDQNFNSYVDKILNNINVSIGGDYSEITKKQLVKTYAMSQLGSYMNFSEPGSGKTLMTLMSLVANVKNDEVIIIVSPMNSMNVWNDEIKKFIKWKNKEVHFHNKQMHPIFSDRPHYEITDFDYAKFILINYESAYKLSNHRTSMKVLNELKGGYHIVFDEAHRVKNGESVRNIISKKLSKNAKSIITLTGTPFSKEVAEVIEMMNLTWPKSVPFISKSKLQEYEYEINLNLMGEVKSIDDIDSYTREVIANLSNAIRPLYFSLKKKQDFDIPDALDNFDSPNIVESLDVQKEIDDYIYEKSSKIKQLIISEKDKVRRNEHIQRLGYYYNAAQQNSINPGLLFSNENDEYSNILGKYEVPKFEDLPKIKEALKIVKEKVEAGEKIVVWFNFVRNIEEFNALLKSNSINSRMIYGDTPPEERKEIIDSFSKKESPISVLISNPATLAESISLHRSVHSSLFVERTFSYFRWAQAKDRIHRVGSPENVEHHYIKSGDLKMEETLFSNLNKKKIVAEELLKHKNDFEGFISQSKLIELDRNDGLFELEFLE